MTIELIAGMSHAARDECECRELEEEGEEEEEEYKRRERRREREREVGGREWGKQGEGRGEWERENY